MGELVAHDHLERAGDRDRRERAEDAGELGADEHRDEHCERRELHRAPVDDGLQEVVFELLVDDEEHDARRSRPGTECRNATSETMIPATVAPASGIRSRNATMKPSANA